MWRMAGLRWSVGGDEQRCMHFGGAVVESHIEARAGGGRETNRQDGLRASRVKATAQNGWEEGSAGDMKRKEGAYRYDEHASDFVYSRQWSRSCKKAELA